MFPDIRFIKFKPEETVVADQFLAGQGTGLEFWQHCRKKHSDIPFVPTSGTNLLEALSKFKTIEACPPFLKKPFSRSHGRNVLKELLEQPSLHFSLRFRYAEVYTANTLARKLDSKNFAKTSILCHLAETAMGQN